MASDSVSPPLRDFQTWMQTFIVAPGTAQEALSMAEQAAGLTEGSAQRLVQRSASLDEVERLMIYRRMYPLRMEEALSIDFPVVKRLLGAQTFRRLVDEYVVAHPSRSWTLDHLGQHMVPFVKDHSLTRVVPGLYDLVCLEQALCEVFNAKDSPVLAPEQLGEVAPERWPDVRFEMVPALVLLELNSNANDLYKAYSRGEELPEVRQGRQHVVVWRQGFQTWRMPLTSSAFQVLALLKDSRSLGEALDGGLADGGDEDDVFAWFQSWVGEGFFQALHLEESSRLSARPGSQGDS